MGFYVAPSKWEVQHASQIFAGQRYAEAHDGALPNTPLWRMLEFRHGLNEKRFDYYHPNVGRILELAGKPTSSPSTKDDVLHDWRNIARGPTSESLTANPPLTPPNPSYGNSTSQDGNPSFGPEPVPEPSAVVMLALAMVSAVLFVGFQRVRRSCP